MSNQPNTGSQSSTAHNHQSSYVSLRDIAGDEQLSATEAAWLCLRRYAQERPEVVALWSFGLGFVLGWKLRIW